jgi:hypothetical protein
MLVIFLVADAGEYVQDRHIHQQVSIILYIHFLFIYVALIRLVVLR